MSRLRFRSWLALICVAILLGACSSSAPVLSGGPPGPSSSTDVITYHYDNQRTGQNLNEVTLTPANVNSTKFGKLGEFTVGPDATVVLGDPFTFNAGNIDQFNF